MFEVCLYFNVKVEQMLIVFVVKIGKVVIGICLGLQLIGEVLGVLFFYSLEKEIGKFLIILIEDGRKDEIFFYFGKILVVGYWYNDMLGLMLEVKIIVYSEGCLWQIVVYLDCVFGFQCYMEFILDVVEWLIVYFEKDLSCVVEYCFVDMFEVFWVYDYSEMN